MPWWVILAAGVALLLDQASKALVLRRPGRPDVVLAGGWLRLRVVMGDVVWSTELRGFQADDPRIEPLRAALVAARQTAECDAAANQAMGRTGRGARCFEARRDGERRKGADPLCFYPEATPLEKP